MAYFDPLDETVTVGDPLPSLLSAQNVKINHLLAKRELPLSSVLAYRDVFVPDGMTPIAIRFDDNPPNDYAAAQALRDRDLVGGFATISENYFERSSSTNKQPEMLQAQFWGQQIMAHSHSHAPDVPAYDLHKEIVECADLLRAEGFHIDSWARPGTWTGIFETFASLDTPIGQAARKTYVALESYIAEGFGTTIKTFPTSMPYGSDPVSVTAGTALATIQGHVTKARARNGSVELLWHMGGASFQSPSGADWLVFVQFLDWLVTERTAGRVAVLTPTALHTARRGPRPNLAPPLSAVLTDLANSGYSSTGTAPSAGPVRTGSADASSVRLEAGAALTLQPQHIEALRSVEIGVWVKAADAVTASAGIRLTMKDTVGNLTDLAATPVALDRTRSLSVPSGGDWAYLRAVLGSDRRAPSAQIKLQATTAPVLFDTLTIFKT